MADLLEYMRDCLNYDATSGILTWKERPPSHFSSLSAWANWNKRFSGKEAGGVAKQANRGTAYRKICVSNNRYLAHRLAWLLAHGEWPNGVVDHIDRNGLNNSLCNLRVVLGPENHLNRCAQKNSASGHVGVSWHATNNKWQANYRGKYLGTFSSLAAAIAARRAKEMDCPLHLRGQF